MGGGGLNKYNYSYTGSLHLGYVYCKLLIVFSKFDISFPYFSTSLCLRDHVLNFISFEPPRTFLCTERMILTSADPNMCKSHFEVSFCIHMLSTTSIGNILDLQTLWLSVCLCYYMYLSRAGLCNLGVQFMHAILCSNYYYCNSVGESDVQSYITVACIQTEHKYTHTVGLQRVVKRANNYMYKEVKSSRKPFGPKMTSNRVPYLVYDSVSGRKQ